MKRIFPVVVALALSALSAQSAEIQITSLPFSISAPGTYVLKSNLTVPPQGGGITIIPSATLTGPVVLDMKGFSLSGAGIAELANNVTIRNGSIINAQGGGSGLVIFHSQPSFPVAQNVVINNVTFDLDPLDAPLSKGTCISLDIAENCTISNCTFKDAAVGIADYGDVGGNSFINDKFALSVLTSMTIQPQVRSTGIGIITPITVARFVTAPYVAP